MLKLSLFYLFCMKLKSVIEAILLLFFHLYFHLSHPIPSTKVNLGVLLQQSNLG